MSKSNFLNIAAVSPDIYLGHIEKNLDEHKKHIKTAWESGNSLLLFPELSLTGVSCGDLFLNEQFLDQAKTALLDLTEYSSNYPGLVVVIGLPFRHINRTYNVSALISAGSILQLVPKINLLNQDIKQESRYFTGFDLEDSFDIVWGGHEFSINCDAHVFTSATEEGLDFDSSRLVLGIVAGSDLSSNNSSLGRLTAQGAELILSPSIEASNVHNQEAAVRNAVNLSETHNIGILQSFAGNGESSSQYVYEAKTAYSELGDVLVLDTSSDIRGIVYTETIANLDAIRKFSKSNYADLGETYLNGPSEIDFTDPDFNRREFYIYPFLKKDNIYFLDETTLDMEIMDAYRLVEILALGLARRVEQIHAETLVLGVSGGLDSTYALLVAIKACDILGYPHEKILAVSMPGFGSSTETMNNANKLFENLSLSNIEISIEDAVSQHFADINQDPNVHDITYENAQARERTQILMDLANQHNGLVIGTGDLSEIALGWSTYNGDQMSMYAVNASIPKTTMRYTLNLIAADLNNNDEEELSDILRDIVETPVSPELLPPDADGNIQQKTEESIGSYTLHDFFLYHYIFRGNSITDTYAIAVHVFTQSNPSGELYSREEIYRIFGIFLRRLYTSQFKRKAFPDAVKATALSLDATGDFRIPSDLDATFYLDEWEELIKIL